MYGGHITDKWDRRTNNTYLEMIVVPEIMLTTHQLTMTVGFRSPDAHKFERDSYERYINEKLPVEIPAMFGLHANAEINYLTTLGETIFSTILSVSGGGGSSGASGTDLIKQKINEILEKLPDDFIMIDIMGKVAKNLNPYTIVCGQECERMNILLKVIRVSLTELDQGLKGQLNITDQMEALSHSLSINQVPGNWGKAYFSKKSLIDWYADLLLRVEQLNEWQEDMETPICLWISGLFNPMSFLTAIMQSTAREHGLPLDDMCLKTDVLNVRDKTELQANAEAGAYIHGFFLEGAGWEYGRGDE